MEEIIGQLIEARKKAKLSLQDIQQRTKIPLRQLEYLEAFQFEKIGPAVYIKGFVRRYAQEVGLDPSALWETEASNQVVPPPRTTRRRKQPVRFNLAPVFRIGTIIALLVIVGMLIYTALLNYFEPSPSVPPDIPPGDEEPIPDDDDQEEPVPEPEVEVESIESDASGAVYVVRNVETLEVRVIFNGRCWMRIIADGQRLQEGTFEPGQEEEWTDAQVFELRIGAPRFATVIVNGIEIDLPDTEIPYNLQIRIEEIE
jgi:cytoskeletal protein RodZ